MRSLEREARMTLVISRAPNASPMLLIHQTPRSLTLRQTPEHPEKTLLVISTEAPAPGPDGRHLPPGAQPH
jgi:hypothetical protein